MFEITLSIRSAIEDDTPPTVVGDVLTYRDEIYDFGPLPEGCEIDVGAPFIGGVTRRNGVLAAKLEYRYTTVTAETHQSTDWSAFKFVISNGACPCPILRRESPVNNPQPHSNGGDLNG